MHINHYFGCNDCNKPTKLKCSGCETRVCLNCYNQSRFVPCNCNDSENIPQIWCRSCLVKCAYCGVESCKMCCDDLVNCYICNHYVCKHMLRQLNCECGREALVCKNECTVADPKGYVCTYCQKQLCLACNFKCQNCAIRFCRGCATNQNGLILCHSCPPLLISENKSTSI